LTGFEDKKNKEATDTIQKVISRYGYAPEFLDLEKQMGAVVSSNTNILFADGRVKIKSVSKIVDENGEPLPVFHVTVLNLVANRPFFLINRI